MVNGTPRIWTQVVRLQSPFIIGFKTKIYLALPRYVLKSFSTSVCAFTLSLKVILAAVFDSDFFWTQDDTVLYCVASLKTGANVWEWWWGCCIASAKLSSVSQQHLPVLDLAMRWWPEGVGVPRYSLSHHLEKKTFQICDILVSGRKGNFQRVYMLTLCLLKDYIPLWYQIDRSL